MWKLSVLVLSAVAVYGAVAGTVTYTEKSDAMKWLEKLEERVKNLEEKSSFKSEDLKGFSDRLTLSHKRPCRFCLKSIAC